LTSSSSLLAPDPVVVDPTPESLLALAERNLYLDGPRCGTLGREILALTDDQPGHPTRAEAWWHIGWAALRYGDRGEALDANRQARAAFAAAGDERGGLLCDEFDCLHLRILEQPEEALHLHERIAARTDVARRPTDLFISHNSRAITRKLLVQTDGMLRDFYRAQSAAELCESPGPRIFARVNLGGCHADLYNLTEAQALSSEAMDLAEAAGAWVAVAVAAFNLIQAYDGLGDVEGCRTVLARLFAYESRMPPQMLRSQAPSLAMACLAVGDLAATRRWLDEGASAAVGDGDGKSDFARVTAGWLIAQGRLAEARAVVDERLACSEGLQDQPYSRMRLLQTASAVCEALDDPRAALRHLHASHTLFEALVARSSRARFIAQQAAHEVEASRRERDRARAAAEVAERDRQRLAALNGALVERIAETQRLNAALQSKMAEAEALQRQLHEQAVHDPLTGLYNRRFLTEAATSRIELAHRNGTPLCIVLIDIDHFKRVNDEHGHDTGDEVLVAFARLLQQRLRRSDIVCRFGGEEFLLLVDPCAGDAAGALLEELLEQFRALDFQTGRDAFKGCTFSAGVALLGEDADDVESLVKIADQRMYRAKAAGRARVCGRGG
jgi:diguanylate cyclase (GGDEF)-like protein